MTSAPSLDIESVKTFAVNFSARLKAVKAQGAEFPWYLYDTIANVWHIDRLLTGSNRDLFERLSGKHIADIGAADGDFAFMMEGLGCTVDIIDNAPTNMNGLQGAALVKQRLKSDVNINHIDLDEYFTLPGKYDFALFMGILYHLQNPYYVMNTLAKNTRRIILSTRVATHPPVEYVEGSEDLGYDDAPLAYLLNADESNGDATNYWIFTNGGLKRLFARTGWKVLDYKVVGCDDRSDPRRDDRDARAFTYLESITYEE